MYTQTFHFVLQEAAVSKETNVLDVLKQNNLQLCAAPTSTAQKIIQGEEIHMHPTMRQS